MITQKRKREELQLLRDEALEAYMNREDFQYDVNGDALYRHYKDQYTQLGQKAMQDTMGQASALTGGYGSSYAQNVGQQAYNSYMEQLGDVIPALYQLAYDRYQDKGNRLYQTYQTWADLEQQAAQQEQWEQEYELEERKRQDAHNRFLLEQESKNSQTQTGTTANTSQPDYWAMLAYYRKLGQNTQSQETTAEPAYDNGKVSEGNIKTMQRVLGLEETGKWTETEHQKAGNLSADDAWLSYQKGQLQNRNSHGQWEQGTTIGNIKTMERVLGLEEDGYWSEADKKAAGGFSAATAWEAHKRGMLQRWKSKGLLDQGLSAGTDQEKKEPEKTAKETQVPLQRGDEKTAWEKKYSGMTYSELRNAISGLEDGAEKDWVITNVLGLTTQLDYTKALQKRKGELGYALALQDEDRQLKKRLRVIEPGSEEAKKIIARRAEIYSQFGDLDDYIKKLNEDIWWLERDEKYKFINQNQDFAEYSKKEPLFMDRTYRMVNNPTKARWWETAAFIHGLAPAYDALNYDNLHYMKDEERAIFNYLYAKRGIDAAEYYLDYLQYELNKRSADFWKDNTSELTQQVPFLSQAVGSLLSTPIALMGGKGLPDAMWQNVKNTITGDDKPVDYNRDAMLPAQLNSTIRDTVEQNIEDFVNWGEEKYPLFSQMLSGERLGDLYQLGMSVQDSAAVFGLEQIQPIVGEVASGVMSDTAATQAMLDAIEKGATDEQALKTGVLRGLLEVFIEKAKVGQLLKIDKEIMRKVVDLALNKGLDGVFDNLEFRKNQE